MSLPAEYCCQCASASCVGCAVILPSCCPHMYSLGLEPPLGPPPLRQARSSATQLVPKMYGWRMVAWCWKPFGALTKAAWR